MAGKKVRILHRTVGLSNLDKVLYPQAGFTKAHVLDYYRRVSPWLLPQLRLRPLTLKRYPDGVEADHFFEKRCPGHRPEWMPTAEVTHRDAKTVGYCMVNDLPELIWIANLASLELHALLSRSMAPRRPTSVVFDLDPGPPAGLLDAAGIGLLLHRVLGDLGLQSFAKVSGGKGLHLYVPLNVPYEFDRTKPFARTVARRVESHYPDRVTSRMSKDDRKGKVFIDWSQNDEHKTTVCAYSLRATRTPLIAAPVSWEEVEHAVDRNREEALRFGPDKVLDRLAEHGDFFAEVLTKQQQLPGFAPEPIGSVDVWTGPADDQKTEKRELAEYRGKRNFEKTPEPAGAGGSTDVEGTFVIQMHAARSLHYDLRLECGGVLKSWAVPKGPSLDPGEKRLAIEVEDHPAAYARFEGRIPDAQYGAGAVIVWDCGDYSLPGSPRDRNHAIEKAIKEGKLEFILEGVKLQGAFVLVRTGKTDQGKSRWLLMKKGDAAAHGDPDPLEDEPYSVLSGLRLEDLAGQ